MEWKNFIEVSLTRLELEIICFLVAEEIESRNRDQRDSYDYRLLASKLDCHLKPDGTKDKKGSGVLVGNP